MVLLFSIFSFEKHYEMWWKSALTATATVILLVTMTYTRHGNTIKYLFIFVLVTRQLLKPRCGDIVIFTAASPTCISTKYAKQAKFFSFLDGFYRPCKVLIETHFSRSDWNTGLTVFPNKIHFFFSATRWESWKIFLYGFAAFWCEFDLYETSRIIIIPFDFN